MKTGKISELMLNRSVFKLFRHRRRDIEKKPTSGADASIMYTDDGDSIAVSTNPVLLELDELGKSAIYYVANNLVCVGADITGVVVNILMPNCSDEKDIKVIMNDLEEECGKLGIEVMGGHTQMTEFVNKTLVTITGIGKIKNEKNNNLGNIKDIKPGFDIVMVKWAGMNGASVIATEGEEKLSTRLPKELIDNVKNLKREISLINEANMAKENGAYYMHDITKGGVYAGLWELATVTKKGLEVDIKRIPIRQDIIEVCEFYDINPYGLDSRGALLVITDDGEKLADKYYEQGIEAEVIGKIAEHKNKLMMNEDEVRYLESPSSDEIYNFLEHN